MSNVQSILRADSLDVIKGFLMNTNPDLDYWFEAEMNHRDLDPTAQCCRWLEAQ